MKKMMVLVMAGALSVLAGCKEDKTEVVQSVEWYKAHTAERKDMLAKCNENPGERMATPNCVNASRADSSTTWGARGGGIKPVAPLTADELKKK
ncbi:EexN family lipoprotein [Pseudomonas aeruginosa]|uniref:EexN family lipoprotein n=1 Tax=Pseudomonas aeruginosa TaxID=287 RepID=UPI0029595CD9|nr:EexN family lipoprotein [Salmonella enterica]HEE6752114.1 EexN family lipoprotein [Pseudomonas aeruginosa]